MSQTQELLSKIQIGSVFIMDPTLTPSGPNKPTEEEFTDCKIHFFYPSNMDIHEQRKQVGISEGIVTEAHPTPFKVLGTELASVIPIFKN